MKTAERKTSLGRDWHGSCLRCEKCNKTLVPGQHSEHEDKPYCNNPCYSALFGPGGKPLSLLKTCRISSVLIRLVSLVAGFGRGGAESYVYKSEK